MRSIAPTRRTHSHTPYFSCSPPPQLKPYEVRFYGRSGTNAPRLLHFTTWAKSVVSYFTTGQGSINMIGLRFMRTLLVNHTARAHPATRPPTACHALLINTAPLLFTCV